MAYVAAHISDDHPWRCVVCDKLSKHSTETVIDHLETAHGLDKDRLKMERMESVYLYPATKEKDASTKTV